MNAENHFHFANSKHLDGVSVLDANMREFAYDKHAHEEFSIGVTLQGRQDFFCQGAYHKNPAGCVLLFNPEDVHDGSSGGQQDLEYLMLYVHPKSVDSQFKALGVRDPNHLRVEGCRLDSLALRNQALMMSSLIKDKQSTRIEQESALFQLSHAMVSCAGLLDELGPSRRQDTLLLRAKEFIQCNLDKDMSIDDIANAASLSKFHFIRLFRAQFGITPHQYVLNCRINGARKALGSGMLSSDVAQAFGFADSSHLNRRFKRVYGMTPKQYQIQVRQLPPPIFST
ncbi:AraC family transcriptional regulator [Enterovibrio norvegicus FF-33]|uniref:AraC family transcriptional regulator n=1 Tax=Enterovibrio norvegicus FF-454 TaxID=1185651 RepID=A0A1E5BYG1_9GAMM|nr:AraC family transcriptional regulator [Enterovibrio norvegicus]OEE58298.1 AraC family transcriptional regulator [Enterovibrio norvegicus FF-454]OEE67209.1 AraC family transcriptional regulator [Enterovibrio norvegicus FF-33]OEE86978.1 AraC family transcriptional regulator [Enterovibrio norvegicus FF-162]